MTPHSLLRALPPASPDNGTQKNAAGAAFICGRISAAQTDTAVRAAQGGGKGIGIEAVIMGDDNIAVIDVHPFDARYIHSGVFQLVGVVSGEAAGV